MATKKVTKREMHTHVAQLAAQAFAQREAAAQARAAEEERRQRESAFMVAYGSATGTPAGALDGTVGTRVYVSDSVDMGELVVEIVECQGKKGITVSASLNSWFEVNGIVLPFWMLFDEVRQVGGPRLFEYQRNLCGMLHREWKAEIDALKRGYVRAQNGKGQGEKRAVQQSMQSSATVVVPAAANPTADQTKGPKLTARPLTWQRIKGEVGNWNDGDLFYDAVNGQAMFIRQAVEAGAMKFVLVGANNDHPLAATHVAVGDVKIDWADVFPKGPVTATSVDDTPMRAARREFARYLALRHAELKAADPAGAQVDYDPLEARGAYDQQSGT